MDTCSYDSAGEASSGRFQPSPLPPPIWDTGSFELASQKPAEIQHVTGPVFGLSPTALEFNSAAERETNGVHPGHGVNGVMNGRADGSKALPSAAVLLSPTKEPPPLLAKPKL